MMGNKIDEKLSFLLKEANLQGFIGIKQIKECVENDAEENILVEKLKEKGVEINNFLRDTPVRSYKTLPFSMGRDTKFMLTTRMGDNGKSFMLDWDSEKELFNKMTAARNKVLEVAFESDEIIDYFRELSDKINNGLMKIYVIMNCDKDESSKKAILYKKIFIESVEKLDGLDKKQAKELLLSLDLNEKGKGIIYNRFTRTKYYADRIKGELNGIEREYSSAKRDIIEANIRLVFSVAKEYGVVHKGILDINDIIQEGNIGLIDAVESYDYTRGNKFSSWAVWYISRRIFLVINSNKKIVNVPMRVTISLHKVLNFMEQYRLLNGKDPSVERIAAEFGIKEKQVAVILSMDYCDVNQDFEFAMLGSEEGNPFDTVSDSVLRKNIENMLAVIKDRDRRIVKLFFGLEDGKERMNFAQIGKECGLSRERVRQIVDESMKIIVENAGAVSDWNE